MNRSILACALLLAALPVAAQTQTEQQPAAAEHSSGRGKVRAACAADIQKFCANIAHEKGAMRTCLDANQSSLSPACSTARAERAAARAKDKG